ncbi:uncharacterized protein BCR38DRAFT_357179 [Pseudomassariella vexata]|uniref:HMG box domain-containing protein n=1 Tax=Pseudomassariella vexata TaxID=1141098 RepID=A0A1Y2D738_9PEZI|nr:uncharacterized protein BCR38DRAFT_357179 [Pseudomassariella vexata]ORY55110.1 hypothetical protein BCR38DRAFT_357179 [Pseudomassariella vexata]
MNHLHHQGPVPPDARLKRKRADSIDINEANRHPRYDELSLYTPSNSKLRTLPTDSPRELICLCTKAPKVPRPRNAFILYRQHYQAQVAAQNPGLANPEISKLIGEQWREQPEEMKNSWKRLAEEEKLRHQRQYPDYRYQPRRGGKGAPGKPTSTNGDDPGHCPKCGGRSIATPRTPSTPFMAASPSSSKLSMPSYMNANSRVIEPDHMRRGSTASMMSADSHGRRYTQPHLRGFDEESGMSPTAIHDAKCRRFNGANGYMPGSPQMGYLPYHIQGSDPRLQRPSISGPHVSTSPLPRPGMQQFRQRTASGMQPPPPPPPHPHPQSQPQHRPSVSESLRLPPLQTQMPNSPTANSEASNSQAPAAPPPNTTYAGTGLGITNASAGPPVFRQQICQRYPQFMYKLDMLRAIHRDPPKPSSPSAEVFEARGIIIAVEGVNPAVLKEVTAVVEKALSISGECAVKIWSEDDQPTVIEAEDDETSNAPTNGNATKKPTDKLASPLANYVAKMVNWHRTSEDLINYITHHPASPNSPKNSSDSSSKEPSADQDLNLSQVLPFPLHINNNPQQIQKQKQLPVAVLSTGYSLSISDKYAAAVPINDTYSREDHWRWVATLWRGIVGADLTIYVTKASEDEIMDNNCVEFANRHVVILRLVEGRGVDEKLERRLGFEIMEWMRSGSLNKRLGDGKKSDCWLM